MTPGPTDTATTRLLSGWGRTSPTAARVVDATSGKTIGDLLDAAPARGVLPRGLGRSYGDAGQNAGGIVLDMTASAALHGFDPRTGTVDVDAGVSLDRLMRRFVPRGWFPAVTPGTRKVTVGGAIAADIHGKNHHVDGSFCEHVTRLTLVTPDGPTRVSPRHDPEVFWATAGSMGLTGVITRATLRLVPIETSYMRVDTERVEDLDELMARMSAGDHRYRYSVAWLDVTGGHQPGRAVLTRADHATRDELADDARRRPLAFDPSAGLPAPPGVPSGLINRFTVSAFNELWWRTAPLERRAEIVPLARFFHPLDAVRGWNRLYGRHGFVQYQFVVPFGGEDVLRAVVTDLRRWGVAVSLAVLKRFGEASPGPLSFPMAGWTLAVDLPVGDPLGNQRLRAALDTFDERVAAAGGRVYLAKDARMRAEFIPMMYPRIDEWRGVRDRLDPDGTLTSDLDRRLELTGLGS